MTDHDPWTQHLAAYQPEPAHAARRGRTPQRGRALPVLAAAAAALLVGLAGGYGLRLATEPDPAPTATVAGCTLFLSSQLRMTLLNADDPDTWGQLNDQVINALHLNPEPECKLPRAQQDEAGRAAMDRIGPDAAKRIQEWAAAAAS